MDIQKVSNTGAIKKSAFEASREYYNKSINKDQKPSIEKYRIKEENKGHVVDLKA